MKTDICTQELTEALEAWVNVYSLEAILNALSNVCALKADHLRETWQDETAATSWLKDSRKLDKFSEKLEN